MIPDSVVEGDDVTLTCKTTCSLTVSSTFTWYKTGRPLPFVFSYNPLRLQSVSQRDAGSYSCAVQGESYRSPAVTLDVQYSPKRVSVSISPSGEIVEGSSVTLTCSSDANPPVELYTWYKVNESSPVGSGQSYSFTLSSNSSGWFYCVAQNKYGTQRADAVFLTTNELQVEIIHNRVLEGDDVTLTCKTTCSLSDTLTFTWYKHASPLSISSNPLHLRSVSKRDAGSYSCAVKGQSYRSPAETLDVQYPPKSVSVSMSPSGGIAEGSSVTMTCNSDANPPVQTYSWYKVNQSSPVGSGRSYSFIFSSNSSGWFYCVAQNKYGTQKAAAVPLTLIESRSVVLYVVLTVTCGCACLFAIGVLYIRKKERVGSDDETKSGQVSKL
ncbi:B-cell receptor CD22-like [Clarias gariepinus]